MQSPAAWHEPIDFLRFLYDYRLTFTNNQTSILPENIIAFLQHLGPVFDKIKNLSKIYDIKSLGYFHCLSLTYLKFNIFETQLFRPHSCYSDRVYVWVYPKKGRIGKTLCHFYRPAA